MMLNKVQIKLNEKNTLLQAINDANKHFPKENLKGIKLNLTYRSFRITYSFLPEIWTRILDDIKLYKEYGEVEATLYSPWAEEREPTKKEKEILQKYKKYQQRLYLDLEDWFLHSYILMDKFAKLIFRFHQLLSRNSQERHLANHLPHKDFHNHRNFYLKNNNRDQITDEQYSKIIKGHTGWYVNELKNIRDDLIQHETVPKLWGRSMDSSKEEIRFSLSRFMHDEKLLDMLYEIRDKYTSSFRGIKEEINFFKLLKFFEEHIDELEERDSLDVQKVRKRFGGDFPDIPKLFNKMSLFFSIVNDHLVSTIKKI